MTGAKWIAGTDSAVLLEWIRLGKVAVDEDYLPNYREDRCKCGRLARVVSCPPCEWCTVRLQQRGLGAVNWFFTLVFQPLVAIQRTWSSGRSPSND